MGQSLNDPVFLVEELPLGQTAVLGGAEGRHAARVRRMEPGQQIELSDGAGGLLRCTVNAVVDATLELVLHERSFAVPPVPRLVVVQALAKGERGELAVELMTEVGVDEVIPWAAARSVTRWHGERGDKGLRRWRSTAREAAKQSRRAWLPVIPPLHDTAAVATRIRSASAALILHHPAARPLSDVRLPAAGDVVLVVGPEGGLAPEELAALADAGGVPCRLGPTVLRTSTAGAAALAALSVALGRWS
ncbi:MAG: 16S rRNA (uracil(1498)-N(3))-methyltransferase [Pseudonocardiales bacterium]